MKKSNTIALATCILSAFTIFAEVITDQQRTVLDNIVRCTSRDTTTIPGSIICTWTKGGQIYRVDTNTVKAVTGKIQTSPIRERLADREAIIERIRSRSVEKRDKYADLEKKALTNTMRAIYAGLVEANQEIIDWCDGKTAEGL